MAADLNLLPVGDLIYYPEQDGVMLYLGDGFWGTIDRGPKGYFEIQYDPEFVALAIEDLEDGYAKRWPENV